VVYAEHGWIRGIEELNGEPSTGVIMLWKPQPRRACVAWIGKPGKALRNISQQLNSHTNLVPIKVIA
jgi:hypothetical protein